MRNGPSHVAEPRSLSTVVCADGRLSAVVTAAKDSELVLVVQDLATAPLVDLEALLADLGAAEATVVRGVGPAGDATLGAVSLRRSFRLEHDPEAPAGVATLSLASPATLVRVRALRAVPAPIADLGALACGWAMRLAGCEIVTARQVLRWDGTDPLELADLAAEVLLEAPGAAAAKVAAVGRTSSLSVERRLDLRVAVRAVRACTDDQLIGVVEPARVPRPRAPAHALQDDGARRVAVLCSDVLGRSMAGPAIRAVELGRVLADSAEVRLGFRAIDDPPDLPFPARALTEAFVEQILSWADVVVVQGPLTDWFPAILASDVAIAVDLYDPFNLEALEHADADVRVPYATRVLLDQIDRGDFFFCASDRQRDYWLGMLSAAGRVTAAAYLDDPDLRSLLDNVPFGLPGEPPRGTGPGPRAEFPGIGADDPLLLWNGGLWDWFDPELFIRAVDRAKREVPNLRALFMGVRRPDQVGPDPEPVRRMIELARDLGLWETHVFARDWTPYDERQNVYLDATAVVSLHRSHLETRFSFRSRLLDCIWAGMPIVCTDGDVLAAIVVDERIGLTVPAGDLELATAALVRIAAGTDEVQAMRRRLKAIAPEWTWKSIANPLVGFVARPRRAAPPLLDQRESRTFDGRQDPPPGSLKRLVPTPVRKHVLGPVKRRVAGSPDGHTTRSTT